MQGKRIFPDISGTGLSSLLFFILFLLMLRLMKRICVFLCALFVSLSLFASLEGEFTDYFLASDIPITYGEQGFRERILERTKGERDPIGLVLTGGSARALAHLGVLQYLEENGIVPDFIVANSMGSIIGMLYAAGLQPAQISEIMTVGEISNYFNFTIPLKGGLLLPESFKTLVKSVVGEDLRLEDLPIPVMVICDDLVTKREIRITEGNFADILVASFALPVYFPPVKYNGHLLIDGGVKSLAPINVAYDYTDTVVISTTFYDLDTINLINPITIINGAFDVGKRQRAAKDMKEYEGYIWIRCNVEQYSFMDFASAEEMAELGYQAAKEQEEALSKLYKAGSHEFDEERILYASAIEKTENNLYYFDRIESSSPSNIIDIGIKSYQTYGYPYYLRDSLEMGLEYYFRYRPLEIRLLAGGSFETRTWKQSNCSPVLSMAMNVYPIQRYRISLEGAFLWDASRWRPSFYVREGMDFKFAAQRDLMDIQFNQSFEYFNSAVSESVARYLLTAQISAVFQVPWGTLFSDFGYQLTANMFDKPPRHYLQGGLSTRFMLPLDFYVDVGVRMRGAVDGVDGVPLYYADGFETNLIIPGYGYETNKKLLTVMSFASGYKLPISPTLGEFLIFKDIEIGGYFDMLLNALDFKYSTGAEIQCVFSLIGLVEVPMRMKIGYESLSDGLCVSMIFSTKY